MSQEERTSPPEAVRQKQEEHWRAIFNETKQALRTIEGTKKGTIRRCCTLLEEGGMPIEMICGKVVKELADFASRKYLFDVIEQKYKDQQKIRAYNHRQTGDTMQKNLQEESARIRVSNEQNNRTEDSVIWQINVEDYRIEDVEKYDRLFLEKLVIYLHNKIENLTKADAAQH